MKIKILSPIHIPSSFIIYIINTSFFKKIYYNILNCVSRSLLELTSDSNCTKRSFAKAFDDNECDEYEPKDKQDKAEIN